MVEIYTDGSCRGNGKENSSGGWGVAAFVQVEDKYYCDMWTGDYCDDTTNNREELKAMNQALMLINLGAYAEKKCYIYSDSAYVVNMCNDWIWKWANNNWTRSGGKPIENLDLVQNIYNLMRGTHANFTIVKVKGHAGKVGNELADAIATNNQAKIAKIMKENEELFIND